MIAINPHERHMPKLSFGLVKAFFQSIQDDKLPLLASSIAFSATFSIAPLFMVLIAAVGWVLGFQNGGHGHHIAEGALIAQVRHNVGQGAADALTGMVDASYNRPRQTMTAAIIGWGSTIAGAMALFSSLQGALNSIWQSQKKLSGWKDVVRARFASFAMILIIGALLLTLLLAQTSIAIIGNFMGFVPPTKISPGTLFAINQVVSLAVATTIFGMLFKVLPDVAMKWRQVWGGAFITAILYAVGQFGISYYFSVTGVSTAYGAAGSLLIVLLWIYYSALIMLIGAEITRFGSAETLPKALEEAEPTLQPVAG
jgi:membrane protein